ncbi:hypothetical protein [Phytohabitans kaempferiae]|uniref:Uncharacterized protein n=1 Tax=Phytohabitans kaempferiae TaxID=1620943 RepID=A0ABV6LZ48_9ACTN
MKPFREGRMVPRRVSLSVVVVLLASVALVASRGPASTSLRVEVTGLPSGVVGHVEVVGPDGSRYTITATDERRVPPGVHVVTIGSVKGSAVTFHPADERHEVVVEAGRTTSTAAPYRVAIPDTTEVLDPDDPAILEVRDLKVVFAAGSPQAAALESGDHLISGEGERVPHMLVRRVAAVTSNGDTIVVDTEPATFDEALPAGVIRLETAEGLTILRPASFTPTDRPDPLVEFSHTLSLRDPACTRGQAGDEQSGARRNAGSVRYQIDDLDLDLDGEFSWDGIVNPTVSVSAGATLAVADTAEGTFEMAVRCAIERDRTIRLGCASVLARIIRIGPIRLGCDLKVVGEAFLEAKGSWKTGVIQSQTSLGFEAGYRSDEGGFHGDRFLTGEETSQPPAAPDVEVSFGASIGLRAELTGQDPVGIAKLTLALDIKAGPTFTSDLAGLRGDFKATPAVTVSARLGRGFLKWDGEAKVNLPDMEIPLWRTTRPTTTPSAPPSPTPTSSPTPRVVIPDQFVGRWAGPLNPDGGEIHEDGTARFVWRYDGPQGRQDVVLDMVLRPDGGGLVGTVTRTTTETHRPGGEVEREPGPHPDAPVSIGLDSGIGYVIYVLVDGEPFGNFCDERAPADHPLCAR